MKKILSLAVVTCMSLSVFAANISKYIQIEGKVKSLTQTDFSISSKFGNYFRTPSIKITRTYDENGFEIESAEYSTRDVLLNKINSAYDAYGNLTEQSGYNANMELLWKNVVTYKDNKKVDSSEYDKNNTLKSKTIYTYDNGNLVDETGYNGDGALIWKIVYKYDESGNYSNITQYYPDGSLDEEEVYTYTEDGRIASISTYSSISNQTIQEVFRYTADGQVSEITTYDGEKQITKRILLKYNSEGNLAKLSEYTVSKKFGTTLNELSAMSEYTYQY